MSGQKKLPSRVLQIGVLGPIFVLTFALIACIVLMKSAAQSHDALLAQRWLEARQEEQGTSRAAVIKGG